MAIPVWLPIAAQVGGSLLGGLLGQGDRNAANDAFNRAMEEIKNLQIPDIEKQKLFMEMYANAGNYSPELQQFLELGPSKVEGISLDPRYKDMQMKALEQMNQIATQGVTDADLAIIEMARRKAAGEAEAKTQQALMREQSMGRGGSGSTLMAMLQSAQSGADRQQQAALEEAARAAQARMQATGQLGQMAGSQAEQEWQRSLAKTDRQDAIARMNAEAKRQIDAANVAARNQAAYAQWQNNQQIANQNVQLRNQQQMYNKQLEQQRFQNELQKRQLMAGMYGQQSQRYDKRASDTAAGWGQIGQGIGMGLWQYNQRPFQQAQANLQNAQAQYYNNYNNAYNQQELEKELKRMQDEEAQRTAQNNFYNSGSGSW